jgi:hypothetical protein
MAGASASLVTELAFELVERVLLPPHLRGA